MEYGSQLTVENKAERVVNKEVEDKESLTLRIENSKYISGGDLEEWHNLRTDFVIKSGWLTPEELTNENGDVADRDRYDSEKYSTFHLLTEDKEGKIAAGMRLTQVFDTKDMLTRDMLIKNPNLTLQLDNNIKSKKLKEIAQRGSLWDITRLISNESADVSNQINGMLQLFGAGIPVTASEDPDRTWIFTTTEPVLNFLKKSGVQPVEVMADGMLEDRNGEEERILVCTVNVQQAIMSVFGVIENSGSNIGKKNAEEIVKGMNKSLVKLAV